jgi:hypothetical protein
VEVEHVAQSEVGAVADSGLGGSTTFDQHQPVLMKS